MLDMVTARDFWFARVGVFEPVCFIFPRARPVYNTVANELRSTICELEVLEFLDHMRSHSVKTD
jgi:hypothetical protein